ncbi:hypothetical protein FGADI_12316 [Fusarium gaditjirri]|uniref:HTH OST-type domain-containing protein n=1 Tax=Fusarium gaditjirri TaxID=282569 RepID=A0A8H4WNY5_9HYPO|nr:hypothetical protein FGADI_12316 [Fusarium gaditjirri]
MTSLPPTLKLAVLIDADNASHNMIGLVLAEIAKYGTAFVKRAYGDWTYPTLSGWKQRLLDNSIQPMQQFAYTVGKNATDSAMIIDAMDLLYSNKFDGFCIVSSDSDFTRLASRIRESGLVVYGCGKRNTPKPFVTACDKFIYVENLVPRMPTPAVEEISGPSTIRPFNGGPSREQLPREQPSHQQIPSPRPRPFVSAKEKEIVRDDSPMPAPSFEDGQETTLRDIIPLRDMYAGPRPQIRGTSFKPEQPTAGPSSTRPSDGGPSTEAQPASSSIVPPPAKRQRADSDTEPPKRETTQNSWGPWQELVGWLEEAVDGSPGADEDGWVRLADVGQLMIRRHPDFDSRNYNFEKLGELIKATNAFDYDRRYPTPGRPAIIYVRPRRSAVRDSDEGTRLDSQPSGLLAYESD